MLQLIAEGITAIAGWGVAAISVVRDDGQMSGDGRRGQRRAPAASCEGSRTSIEGGCSPELAKADDWGLLRFVPHERLDAR